MDKAGMTIPFPHSQSAAVTDPAGTVTRYAYDALGRRTQQIEAYTDGVPTDDSNRIMQYTYDGNYNVTAVLDASGAVLERYISDPYGLRIVLHADGTVKSTNVSAYAFEDGHQGGTRDGNTGLYSFRNRWLNSSQMRWNSPDPLGYVDGMSYYEYVRGNPVARIDPSGLITLYFGYLTEIEVPLVPYQNPVTREAGWFTGGVKTLQGVDVDPDACKIILAWKQVGTTDWIGRDGTRQTGVASGDSITQTVGRTGGRGFRPCGKCILTMRANERNPLVLWGQGPRITYIVTVTFDTRNREYRWRVSHDRFPSHRFYDRNGLLYRFSHVINNTSPRQLFLPARNGSASGTVSY